MEKLLTVITCARNEEKNIGNLIKNIKKQTFKNFVHIIVDDNSTDNTVSIIKNFAKNDNRFVLKKYPYPHTGVHRSGPARNYGLEGVRTKYIAVIDADDISHKDRFSKQIDFLENNSDIGIVGTNGIVINSFEKYIFKLPETNKQIKKTIFIQNPFIVSSVMMKSEVFFKIGGFLQTQYGNADVDAWYRAYLKGIKFHNLQEPLTTYYAMDVIPYKHIYYSFKLRIKFIINTKKYYKLLFLPISFFRQLLRNIKQFLKSKVYKKKYFNIENE